MDASNLTRTTKNAKDSLYKKITKKMKRKWFQMSEKNSLSIPSFLKSFSPLFSAPPHPHHYTLDEDQ